jgi:hypothetical protein
MSSWQVYVKCRRQKATADAYAASRLQQQVFLAWAQEACQARGKVYAAVNMASRVQARVHNQTLFRCFAAWRARVQRAAAVQVRRQARRLAAHWHTPAAKRSCQCAWCGDAAGDGYQLTVMS